MSRCNGAVMMTAAQDEQQAIQILADRVMVQIDRLFTERAIQPNAVQQQMLSSHVRAMALRSVTGEALPEVEEDLFEDISEDSLGLAQQVVNLFGNLPEEEAWLLSVHFEVAKND
ncbi:glycine dehydrogenase [Enterobacteriaceae bacterium LUAb1]